MATYSNISPEDLAYYTQQQAAVRNTQAIGMKEDENAAAGADLTYSQKLQSLQEKLTQEGNALPDKFAARGIQNSGIFNYGGGNQQYTGSQGTGFNSYAGLPNGQLGANQQFKSDAYGPFGALSDVKNQQENVDQGYSLKEGDLVNTADNQISMINATETAQQAAQAAVMPTY